MYTLYFVSESRSQSFIQESDDLETALTAIVCGTCACVNDRMPGGIQKIPVRGG